MPETTIIIGGGDGGMFAALEEASRGRKVILKEMKPRLGEGTSNGSACRLNFGLHYPKPKMGDNSKTAGSSTKTTEKCIQESVKFVRALATLVTEQKTATPKGPKPYEQFFLDEGDPKLDHLRDCNYYLHYESESTPEDVQEICRDMVAEYKRLCDKDPENQVFGPPDKLFRVLDQSELPDKAIYGVQIAERFINWPKVCSRLKRKIDKNPNITVHYCQEVIAIEPPTDENGYQLVIRDAQTKGLLPKESAQIVINASWQSIDMLNETAGDRYIPHSKTKRLKMMPEGDTPEEYHFQKSGVWVHGPYAVYTNLGDGKGLVTAETVINLDATTDKEISEKAKEMLEEKFKQTENPALLSQAAFAAAGKFFKNMEKTKYNRLRTGIVITPGNAVTEDGKPNLKFDSPIRDRNYSGDKRVFLGLQTAETVKLTHAPGIAQKNSDCIDRDKPLREHLPEIINGLLAEVKITPSSAKKLTQQSLLQSEDKTSPKLTQKNIMRKLLWLQSRYLEGRDLKDIKETIPTMLGETIKRKAAVVSDIPAHAAKFEAKISKPDAQWRKEDKVREDKNYAYLVDLAKDQKLFKKKPVESKALTPPNSVTDEPQHKNSNGVA